MLTQLRATALHAELLGCGAAIPDIHSWRARCGTLVETLRDDLRDASCPPARIDEISLAQCVLLDELTLRVLPLRQQHEWLRESLQMRFHRVSDGAVRVRARIDALLATGRQDAGLLELYGIVLELGFDGDRESAGACLQRVKSALDRLAPAEPASSGAIQTTSTGAAKGATASSRAELTRWIAGVVMVAAVAIGTLWIAFDASLRSAIGRLPDPAIAPISTAPHEDVQ
ncbi:DotU family type IV/VI secretion system protein [Paraburkholderia sp. MMS20-SJTR3]|uniref:DotU family type IV/VI secretion system protein n=1 Tax=Paraburkholderia sejongensis TaxID=2886946 RepID=A0ABS8K0K1_9BURK|nr:DotU family type IV/VI secretion system protein [Paraburkholderia sp. MMS20-SJTR3]MCC8395680.1 DotU family type IV/VI secretion system protein [Paraburkholderia sp. MMS20-SJTR3]